MFQFVMRNRLDEVLGSPGCVTIEFRQLCGGGACRSQSFSFRNHLTHQPDLLRLCGVETAAGQQEIADNCVSDIALQAGDSAESGNQPQSQFRESKTSCFVGDDQIASQSQFEPSAERDAVYCGNGGNGSGVDHVEGVMNALQKVPHTLDRFFYWHRLGTPI